MSTSCNRIAALQGCDPLIRFVVCVMLVWGGLLAAPALPAADQHPPMPAADDASTETEWLLPAGVSRDAIDSSRLITASAGVTEIVCALGAGDRIVAVDASAALAACAAGKTALGYYAQLSGEGVLAQQPTLILSDERIGPATTVAQLEAAGVPIVLLRGEKSAAGLLRRIETIAHVLQLPAEGEALRARLDNELKQARARIPANMPAPKILVLLSAHAGRLNAAGTQTYADALIELVGGTNVCAGFAGYRPLTPESAVGMAPDWILVAGRDTTEDQVREMLATAPAIMLTPAVQHDQLVVRPAAELLAFGPRLGEIVNQLVTTIYGATHDAK